MKFSEDFIEKVRDANDIVELIERHTVLKSSGRSYMGLCPFPDHQEKSPSFSVSQDKQLYHCFGCGKSGNIYSFLRDFYGYNFPESIEFLAKKAGIPIPKETFEQSQADQKIKTYKKALQVALDQYQRNLKSLSSTHPAKKYLERRGLLKPELLETLKIGWALDSWDDLVKIYQKMGLSLEVAQELGLVKRKRSQNGYFDGFRARVMFPVFSFSGEVVGFGGRVLGDEKPKYINSPESMVFKKSKIFYGQNWASPYIRQEDEAIVVEGYTDWISLYQHGIQNVLATMGTALTEYHGQKLKTWCQKVICLFDGDQAGMTASERALSNLLPAGLLVRGVFLPEGEDPDSFVKKQGPQKTKAVLKNSEDLFLRLLDIKLKAYSGKPHEKIEVLNWVGETLAVLPSGSPLYSVYIQEVDSRLSLGVNTIKNEILKFKNNTKSQESSPAEKDKEPPKTAPAPAVEKKVVRVNYKKNDPEYIVFSLALGSVELQKELIDQEIQFTDPGMGFLWSLVKDKYRQNGPNSAKIEPYLASFCSNPESLTLTMEKPYSQLDENQKRDIFQECLERMKDRNISTESKKMRQKMGPNSDEEELKRFMELQKQKRNLKK